MAKPEDLVCALCHRQVGNHSVAELKDCADKTQVRSCYVCGDMTDVDGAGGIQSGSLGRDSLGRRVHRGCMDK